MAGPSDEFWRQQGQVGGTRPTDNDSQKAWDAFNRGREERSWDRIREQQEENSKRYNPWNPLNL